MRRCPSGWLQCLWGGLINYPQEGSTWQDGVDYTLDRDGTSQVNVMEVRKDKLLYLTWKTLGSRYGASTGKILSKCAANNDAPSTHKHSRWRCWWHLGDDNVEHIFSGTWINKSTVMMVIIIDNVEWPLGVIRSLRHRYLLPLYALAQMSTFNIWWVISLQKHKHTD